jgi:hypothetical protein
MSPFPVWIAAGLLAGCQQGPSTVRQHLAQWQAQQAQHYVFEYEESCFCLPRETFNPVRIEVLDGRVIRIEPLDSDQLSAGPTPRDTIAWELHRYPTVGSVYTQLLDFASRKPASLKVTWNTVEAYPRFVSIDRWADVVVDELTISIRNLRRLP